MLPNNFLTTSGGRKRRPPSGVNPSPGLNQSGLETAPQPSPAPQPQGGLPQAANVQPPQPSQPLLGAQGLPQVTPPQPMKAPAPQPNTMGMSQTSLDTFGGAPPPPSTEGDSGQPDMPGDMQGRTGAPQYEDFVDPRSGRELFPGAREQWEEALAEQRYRGQMLHGEIAAPGTPEHGQQLETARALLQEAGMNGRTQGMVDFGRVAEQLGRSLTRSEEVALRALIDSEALPGAGGTPPGGPDVNTVVLPNGRIIGGPGGTTPGTGTGGTGGGGSNNTPNPPQAPTDVPVEDLPDPPTVEIPEDPTDAALARQIRAMEAANMQGRTAAGLAIAGGAYGSTRGALAGGANMQSQAAAQGALAGDRIVEQDLARQLQGALADAGYQAQYDLTGYQGQFQDRALDLEAYGINSGNWQARLGANTDVQLAEMRNNLQAQLQASQQNFAAQQAELDRQLQQAIQAGNLELQRELQEAQIGLARDQMEMEEQMRYLDTLTVGDTVMRDRDLQAQLRQAAFGGGNPWGSSGVGIGGALPAPTRFFRRGIY